MFWLGSMYVLMFCFVFSFPIVYVWYLFACVEVQCVCVLVYCLWKRVCLDYVLYNILKCSFTILCMWVWVCVCVCRLWRNMVIFKAVVWVWFYILFLQAGHWLWNMEREKKRWEGGIERVRERSWSESKTGDCGRERLGIGVERGKLIKRGVGAVYWRRKWERAEDNGWMERENKCKRGRERGSKESVLRDWPTHTSYTL